ncbi:MAG: hypothetical protein ABL967_10160 [Bryobacteraceae bacterium]
MSELLQLTIMIPAVVIAIAAFDLLRRILSEGQKKMQSRKRRDAVMRWVREEQIHH